MRILFIVVVVVCSAACNKADDAPAVGQPPDACGSVSGVHHTDVNGVLMYPADSTDWRSSDEWCATVEALFADRPAVIWDTLPPDSLHIACFPNPTDNQFIIGFYRADTSYVDIRFVDAQFQLLLAFDSLTSDHVLFRTDSIGITGPQVIRAYYRIVHADGTAYRGHGDVQIDL